MFGPHVDRVHARGKPRPTITAHIRAARAAAAGADFDARSFQIFVANPRNKAITMRPEEEAELRAYLAGNPGLRVTAHGTYSDYPWHGSEKAVAFIHKELEICERAGITGLVIHLGKPDVAAVMGYIPRLLAGPSPVAIYLETPAVKPENANYETPEKLAALFHQLRTLDPDLCRFGLCIDTAHLWSCGVDLSSFEAAEAWLTRLEAVADVIPPDRIMLHLNDSLEPCGNGVDAHGPLLAGRIWGGYADRPQQSGLAAFVDYAVRNKIEVILERKPAAALLEDYTHIDRLTDCARLG